MTAAQAGARFAAESPYSHGLYLVAMASLLLDVHVVYFLLAEALLIAAWFDNGGARA